ncbi:MAG: carbohydrate binding domain-containing protein, partial [Pyrinomonadaceae bacterium]
NAHQFRAAAAVVGDLTTDDRSKPTIAQITNGGFENGVKLRNAGPFEWQVGEAAEPQIGLSEDQKHGGRFGLTMVFNTFRPEGYRDISQQIAVEPGARYRLDAWYKSNLKTEAKYKWQILDASTGKVLGTTQDLTPTDNWTAVSVEVAIPAESDGIRLGLLRSGCTSVACPVTGTLAFDDLSLTKE